MHFSAAVVLVAILSFFLEPALTYNRINTKGINCKGEDRCKKNMDAMEQIRYFANHGNEMGTKGVEPERLFDRNQLIVCDAFGFICAYLKHTDEKISGKRALELLDVLYHHGCEACGSVPTAWPNNHPKHHHHPELSVDKIGNAIDHQYGYDHPYCRGLCEQEEFIGIPLGQPKNWPEMQNLELNDDPKWQSPNGRDDGIWQRPG